MLLPLDFGSAARNLHSLKQLQGESSGNSDWAGPVFFLCVTIVIAAIISIPVWTRRKQRSFPDVPYSRKSVMELHLAIGGIIIPEQPEALIAASRFITNYFDRHFSDVQFEYSNQLLTEIKQPASLKSIVNWTNKNLNNEQKSEVIRFVKELYQTHSSAVKYAHRRKQISRLLTDLGSKN